MEIASVCEAAADCKSIIYGMKEANDLTNSHITSSSSRSSGHSSQVNTPPVLAYYTSVFCLTPPGDDPTRRGLIDSLLAGCIPVTFNPNTLLNQLPLHLTATQAQEIGVYIPLSSFMNKGNLIHILRSIPSAIVKEKQLLIARLAPGLQYSVPPVSYLQAHTNEVVWDPPLADAVDVMVEALSVLSVQRQKREDDRSDSISRGSGRRGKEGGGGSLFPNHPTLQIDLLKEKKQFLKYYKLVTFNGSKILL
jgi:hypothetical protein